MRIAVLAVALVLASCARKGPTEVLLAHVASGSERFDVQGPVAPWAPDPAGALMPVGRWVRAGDIVAWSYVDSQAGLSVRWDTDRGASPGSIHVRRLTWAPADLHVLTDEERAAAGLPERPDWVEAYGPQPPPGALHGAWRADPRMAHRFHPDYPDDLRVVVGGVDTEGGQIVYDVVWIRVRACEDGRCEGNLLNQPDSAQLPIGADVWFDAAALDADRLPVAAAAGAVPHPDLVSVVASAPEFAGMLQDPELWTVDTGVPPAERLVPIGQWARVGEELVYFFVGPTGPVAAVVSEPQRFESLTWAPRGMQLLQPDEVVRLELPGSLEIGGAPPQPPPGFWGGWRVDPATSWLFGASADPDVALVVIEGSDGVASLRITGCDARRCQGELVTAHGAHAAGAELELRHLRVSEEDVLPVAWPLGTEGPRP